MLTPEDRKYLEIPLRWFQPPSAPVCCTQRLEEGWEWIVDTVKGQPLSDLRGRLTKSNQVRSAVEEIILARGFVHAFGRDAVRAYPKIPPTSKRAEFLIRSGGAHFVIEATGLTSPDEDRLTTEAIESGEFCWHEWRDPNLEMGRLCEKIATKVSERPITEPLLLCLNQYAYGPSLGEVHERLKHFLLEPDKYGVPASIQILGVAHASNYFAQGVWLRHDICDQWNIGETVVMQIKEAIQQSYFPRSDGSFELEVI